MRDLSTLGEQVSMSLKVGDQIANNLFIGQGFLHNSGKAPILPTDFVEPLRVSVKQPWKILMVENGRDFGRGVKFQWKRVDDTTFEAAPTLLNPGDDASIYLYITNTKQDKVSESALPIVEWNARIVNLRSLYEEDALDKLREDRWGLSVQLSGWALPFTIVAALIFQCVYLQLMSRSGMLPAGWGTKTILIAIFTSLGAFVVAESMSTYLFSSALLRVIGIDHTLNLPPILLHVAFLVFLVFRYRRSAASPRRSAANPHSC